MPYAQRSAIYIFSFFAVALPTNTPTAVSQERNINRLPEFIQPRAVKTRESFVSSHLGRFRSIAGDDLTLTKSDIEQKRRESQANARALQVQNLLRLDLNNDLVVTRDELTRDAASKTLKYQSRAFVSKFDKLDTNNDGKITVAEAAVLQDRQIKSIERNLRFHRQLLDGVPGANNSLTLIELSAYLTDLFDGWDTNGNHTIDGSEKTALNKLAANKRLAERNARRAARKKEKIAKLEKDCALPKAMTDNIILIGAYEAGAISSVSTTGPNRVTEAANLVIEPGDEPLYVIANAYTPMIWSISGATERIERFVAVGSHRHENYPIVGVVGLEKNKITFPAPGACPSYSYRENSGRAKQAKAVFGQLAGKPIKKFVGSYTTPIIKLPSGKITSKNKSRGLHISLGAGDDLVVTPDGTIINELPSYTKQRAPSGVDQRTYREFLRFSPFGVRTIDPSRVIANGEVMKYDVLPQQAGLLQLIKQGKIERLSDGVYYIKQPIPHFPAGLAGAHSVKFMIAKGVPIPPGSPGHSKVISEETGKRLGREMFR